MKNVIPELLPGACDCHVHVIGCRSAYPMMESRQYTPPEAGVDALKGHLVRLGLENVVLVQPSIYGTDNQCLLDSLESFNGRARGVVVLDEGVDPDYLQQLDTQGVRGVRLNFESAHLRDPKPLINAIDKWVSRIELLGWHLQVFASLNTISEVSEDLKSLPVSLVLDHFAMIPSFLADSDPRVKRVFRLIEEGACYVKLSAPYRIIGGDEARYEEVERFAKTLLQLRPDRLLWGSDWPHTNREPGKDRLEVSAYKVISPEFLASTIRSWLYTDDLVKQVMVDNPERLYRFR